MTDPTVGLQPARKLRRDAVENRRRLLDAADAVFAEHGLDAGVDEVARVAGVGVGTLYRRFPTKDALVAELVRELLDDLLALAQDALAVPGGNGLEQFLYAMGSAQAAHRGCLARLWHDEETAARKAENRALVQQLLADAQKAGRIRADATREDIDLLFWSLRGVLAAHPDGSGAWRRQVAIMVAGLRPSSESLPARMV